MKAKSDTENSLRRKETELHNLGMKLEDEQAAVAKLQKSIQQDEAKMRDLNDQLVEEKVPLPFFLFFLTPDRKKTA